MRLIKAAKVGLKSLSRGYGSGPSGSSWFTPTIFGNTNWAGRDWNREAGLRFDNSIVEAAVLWAIKAMSEVDVYVQRKDPKTNKFYEVEDHPITKLLKNPYPDYGWHTLLGGMILSELVGTRGESYTYKHRSPAGKVVALEYLPHFAVSPYTAPESGNLLDAYLISSSSGYKAYSPQDVLRLGFGHINPLKPQEHWGPLNSALVEVGADKHAFGFTAAMLINLGITPHLITPKDVNGPELTPSLMEKLRESLERQIGGSNRFKVAGASLPVELHDLTVSPEALKMDYIHNLSEERVCAVLGVPVGVIGLGTGLENANNRASATAAERAAARRFTKPYMVRKGAELTRDLVPELGQPGDEVVFRVSAIEALQEDKTETAKRDELELNYMTINEKRAEKGLPSIEGGDVILPLVSKGKQTPKEEDLNNDE